MVRLQNSVYGRAVCCMSLLLFQLKCLRVHISYMHSCSINFPPLCDGGVLQPEVYSLLFCLYVHQSCDPYRQWWIQAAHTSLHACMYACVHVYTYICMYVCVYALCMCVSRPEQILRALQFWPLHSGDYLQLFGCGQINSENHVHVEDSTGQLVLG